MTKQQVWQQVWRVQAGLRFLSMVNPPHAEAKWAGRQAHRRAVADLAAAGKLSSYNIIQKEPTGEKRYITHFASGGGRNWVGGFPAEVAAFETVEIDLTHAAAGSAVADAVAGAAKLISPATANAVAGNIAKLRWLPEQPRLAELSIFHWGADEAGFVSGNMGAIAEWLIEFFQHALAIYLANRESRSQAAEAIERYKSDLLAQYSEHSEPGIKVVYLLLLIEIWRAALPDWPFGELHWVCGATECSHPLCNAQRNSVLSSAGGLPGFLGAGLAMREIHSYTLKHTATIGGVLREILAHAQGPRWVNHAGAATLQAAEELRDKLSQAASAERFYDIQHEIMAFAPVAELAFDQLSSNGASETHSGVTSLKRAADEIKARAQNAVQLDFENAIDLRPLLECRAELSEHRKQSPQGADDLLQKWLHDETMFPALWEPFLAGLTDDLPFPEKWLDQQQSSGVRRAWEAISRFISKSTSQRETKRSSQWTV